jgi:Mg2+ and Co2+ transporter CorA
MAPTLDEILDAFNRQVETLVDQVQQVENAVFRKALYVSMLDGLSACAYGNDMTSGERFRTFILQIGGWTNGERISLPQAALLFRGDPAMSATISGQLANWAWGTPQPITSDPFPQALQIGNADLRRVQHLNLLWKFRNSLLHAVHDPGGFDLRGGVEPYYVGDIASHTWRLVIPEEFLRSLLTASLQGLLAFCKREGRDPQEHLGKELWV